MLSFFSSHAYFISLFILVCADEGGSTRLGLLLSGVFAAFLFCSAFIYYLCKVRSRTSASYRDYLFVNQKQVRKQLDDLKQEKFELYLNDLQFLQTDSVSNLPSPRTKRVLSINRSVLEVQKIQENLERAFDFSGNYQISTRILRTDNVTKGIWILRGTEIFEQWLQTLLNSYKETTEDVVENDQDSFPEMLPTNLSDEDSSFISILQKKIGDDEEPLVHFDSQGSFLFPFLSSFDMKPYWESYDEILCCGCNSNLIDSETPPSIWWYSFHHKKAYCKACLPEPCGEDSIHTIYCGGQDKIGDFELYGAIDDLTGKVVAYQQYKPNTKTVRKKLTGKVQLQHNYGHTVFMRLIPDVENTHAGYWMMNTRSWEDCDRVIFSPMKDKVYGSNLTLSRTTRQTALSNAGMRFSLATINLEKWEDMDGDIAEVGVFTVRGAEIVGFLQFHPGNYPTFTHTFDKKSKRIMACAPNLCFGEVVSGDRLICIEQEDLWDATKEYVYDFMKDKYDAELKIQVDRGHKEKDGLDRGHSTLRLLFKHDQEVHPAAYAIRKLMKDDRLLSRIFE